MDIEQIIKEKTGKDCAQSGEVTLPCPFCGERRHKFAYNVVKEEGHCWMCERVVKGNDEFLSKVVGVSPLAISAVKADDFSGWAATRQKVLQNFLTDTLGAPMKKKPNDLPKGAIKVGTTGGVLLGEVVNYLRGRGFSLGSIFKYLVPYFSYSFTNRIILPARMDGEIVYWVARNLGVGEPKYIGPGEEEGVITKRDVLYNYDFIEENKPVVICEGIFSAISVIQHTGINAVALFGKTMSQKQKSLLLKKKPSCAIIVFDGQGVRDNTIHYAQELSKQLIDHVECKLIRLPEGKDPNDLGEEIRDFLK